MSEVLLLQGHAGRGWTPAVESITGLVGPHRLPLRRRARRFRHARGIGGAEQVWGVQGYLADKKTPYLRTLH